MNKSIYAIPSNKILSVSNEIKQLLNILNMVNDWVTEVEPLKESCRFGNKAFSSFYNLLKLVRLLTSKLRDVILFYILFIEIARRTS